MRTKRTVTVYNPVGAVASTAAVWVTDGEALDLVAVAREQGVRCEVVEDPAMVDARKLAQDQAWSWSGHECAGLYRGKCSDCDGRADSILRGWLKLMERMR